MNKPKSRKRAAHPPTPPTGPSVLFHPVSDHVAAYIGLIVTQYVHLEQAMIGVFRVILGIESGEAANLAYNAITAPKLRWDIARKVLEKDHRHIATPTAYDDLIDEFHKITSFRNMCVHSLWQVDQREQPWVTETREPMDKLYPKRFLKAEFDAMIERMEALRKKITDVSQDDRWKLDRRWLGLSLDAGEGSPSRAGSRNADTRIPKS